MALYLILASEIDQPICAPYSVSDSHDTGVNKLACFTNEQLSNGREKIIMELKTERRTNLRYTIFNNSIKIGI